MHVIENRLRLSACQSKKRIRSLELYTLLTLPNAGSFLMLRIIDSTGLEAFFNTFYVRTYSFCFLWLSAAVLCYHVHFPMSVSFPGHVDCNSKTFCSRRRNCYVICKQAFLSAKIMLFRKYLNCWQLTKIKLIFLSLWYQLRTTPMDCQQLQQLYC